MEKLQEICKIEGVLAGTKERIFFFSFLKDSRKAALVGRQYDGGEWAGW